MKHGVDQRLSDEEILRRDERIAATLVCIERLELHFSIGLQVELYERLLVPGIPGNIVGGGQEVFGEAWLDKTLDYVEKLLLDDLAKVVLQDIGVRPRNDCNLRGSAWAVARRLCLQRFAGYYRETKRYEFDCDVSALRIGLDDLIEVVQERLVNQYMTYRLWDEEALKQLEHYLYYAVPDSDIFIEGALSTGVYGRPANVQEFLAGVNDAIADLPMRDLAECTFPDDYPDQVLFSEYVPAQNMTAEQIQRLYQHYLAQYAEDQITDIAARAAEAAASSVLLNAVEQSQAVVARWIVPEGISAEQAMKELVPLLDNQAVMYVMRDMDQVLGKGK